MQPGLKWILVLPAVVGAFSGIQLLIVVGNLFLDIDIPTIEALQEQEFIGGFFRQFRVNH